jgi:hypothetical protein
VFLGIDIHDFLTHLYCLYFFIGNRKKETVYSIDIIAFVMGGIFLITGLEASWFIFHTKISSRRSLVCICMGIIFIIVGLGIHFKGYV